MLFQDYHIHLIREGEKTVTRRDWDDNYNSPNVGSVIPATTGLMVPVSEADCFIRIEDHYEERLGDMTDADARKEGAYETVEEFKDSWTDIYGDDAWDPELEVTVVEFEYVGRTPVVDDD